MIQEKSNTLSPTNKIKLSIQVALDGLCFSSLDIPSNSIITFKRISFKHCNTVIESLEEITRYFSTHPIDKNLYHSITIIHDNELCSFVPKAFFKEEQMANYLKYNIKILDNDFITFDTIEEQEMVNVYVPYVNINNYFLDTIGSFNYKHASSIYIESLLKQSKKNHAEMIYVYPSNNRFSITVIRDKKLLFFNHFYYSTPQDYIYYLLFTIEQLGLNTELVRCYLLGDIQKQEDLYKLTYTYIRYVSYLKMSFTFDTSCIPIASIQEHYTILNSFLCE